MREPKECGQFATEVRIYPWHELLSHPYELGLMKWLMSRVVRVVACSTTTKEQIMPRQPARASSGRYVSRLTGGTLAIIMAGGRGERLKDLTAHRCKPATPFGGKFRIIDFVLSNCVNSGIRQISILTQYKAQSLIQHVQRGWSYLRGEFGEFVETIPAQQQLGADVVSRHRGCGPPEHRPDPLAPARSTCWCSRAITSTRWTTVR